MAQVSLFRNRRYYQRALADKDRVIAELQNEINNLRSDLTAYGHYAHVLEEE